MNVTRNRFGYADSQGATPHCMGHGLRFVKVLAGVILTERPPGFRVDVAGLPHEPCRIQVVQLVAVVRPAVVLARVVGRVGDADPQARREAR